MPPQSLDLSATLGAQIADAGLSCTKVAKRLGLHPSIPIDWANGKRAVPSYRLEALAGVLGISRTELTTGSLQARRGHMRRRPPPVADRPYFSRPSDDVLPVSPSVVRCTTERMEAYSFALSWGPSPVPGRPRSRVVA